MQTRQPLINTHTSRRESTTAKLLTAYYCQLHTANYCPLPIAYCQLFLQSLHRICSRCLKGLYHDRHQSNTYNEKTRFNKDQRSNVNAECKTLQPFVRSIVAERYGDEESNGNEYEVIFAELDDNASLSSAQYLSNADFLEPL